MLKVMKLGEKSANALEQSFAVFYRLGLSLSFLRDKSFFGADRRITNELAHAFCSLLNLVCEVTTYYVVKLGMRLDYRRVPSLH